MTNTLGWSRVQGTELELEAYIRINENEIRGCTYHNNQHIEDMYVFLQAHDVIYDEALDWAVLFHDVVYDPEADKERRSAELFLELSNEYRGCNLSKVQRDQVYDLIMATADHRITPATEDIIQADLHQLTNVEKTITNFSKILTESMNLYEIDDVKLFATANKKFMGELKTRIDETIENSSDVEFFDDVKKGIDLTSAMSDAILKVDI